MNTQKHMQKNNWEERFDEKFVFNIGNRGITGRDKKIKSFIAQILEEERERLVEEIDKMMDEHRMRECPMKGRMSQCTKDMCFHWTPSWESIINLIKK